MRTKKKVRKLGRIKGRIAVLSGGRRGSKGRELGIFVSARTRCPEGFERLELCSEAAAGVPFTLVDPGEACPPGLIRRNQALCRLGPLVRRRQPDPETRKAGRPLRRRRGFRRGVEARPITR